MARQGTRSSTLIAGIGVMADARCAPGSAIADAALSLLLTAAQFHPWLTLNVVINEVIISLAV